MSSYVMNSAGTTKTESAASTDPVSYLRASGSGGCCLRCRGGGVADTPSVLDFHFNRPWLWRPVVVHGEVDAERMIYVLPAVVHPSRWTAQHRLRIAVLRRPQQAEYPKNQYSLPQTHRSGPIALYERCRMLVLPQIAPRFVLGPAPPAPDPMSSAMMYTIFMPRAMSCPSTRRGIDGI